MCEFLFHLTRAEMYESVYIPLPLSPSQPDKFGPFTCRRPIIMVILYNTVSRPLTYCGYTPYLIKMDMIVC